MMQRDGEGDGTRPSTFRVAPGVKRVSPVSSGPVLKGKEIFVRAGRDGKRSFGLLTSECPPSGKTPGSLV